MSTLQATNLKHGSSASNNIVLDASGNTTISGALSVSGVTGSVYPLVPGTAQASTSGTSIDFTGIPSWVKRVTVMFNEVSTNGTSLPLVQLGAGAIQTSSYVSTGGEFNGSNTTATASSSAGFVIRSTLAANAISGAMQIVLIASNTWVNSHTFKITGTSVATGGGAVALSDTLDRVRITTVGGTDTFDAGSINIMYEG
jgi:hypothetical protein